MENWFEVHVTVSPNRRLHFTVYGTMLIGAIALFMAIDRAGANLDAPRVISEESKADAPLANKSAHLANVLLALLTVIVVGRAAGVLFRYIGQPPVIGEVVGGILLGPSLLGRFWPAASEVLFPASVLPSLNVIAQLGIVLYMFLVGLELNPGMLRERAHATLFISHAGIAMPFVMGAALALFLYPRLSNSNVPFTSFALFMGVALAITAFPVLARILSDRGMQRSPLGVLALGCAATGDATAWCLLAFVVGVAQAQVGSALLVVALTAAFIAVMILAVRPIANRWLGHVDEASITPTVVAIVFAALLLSSLTAEAIGIHALFGAFLLGAILPHDGAIARTFTHKLEDLVTVLLLPAFFAVTGLRTRIDLVEGLDAWLICGLIILVATVGKLGGTVAASRFSGLAWRESLSLGVLMNTRGLMELIVLNVGLEMKVISPTLFAMMVIMAIVTTLATTPVLNWLKSPPAAK